MSSLLPTQISRLEQKLNLRKITLLAQIHSTTNHRFDEPYATLTGEVSDMADAASADLLVDIDHALIGIELEELRDIEAAQTRIKKQIYGVCEECGLPIAYARLKVYPTARRCTLCQGVHEHTYHGASHASI
jgi:DnaK suppressor protein